MRVDLRCSGYFYFISILMPSGSFFSVYLSVSSKRKTCSPGSVLLCSALVGCVCPALACNCRPSPALLITTVIIIIAVCYPRAQATPGCSDLSSPSFLSRTLSPSPALVVQTCCWAKELLQQIEAIIVIHRLPLSSFFCSSPVLPFCCAFLAGRRAQ